MARCALIQLTVDQVVACKSVKSWLILPLLLAAFSLALTSPIIFGYDLGLMLICDDVADIFVAGALFFALTRCTLKLKLFSLGYLMWCVFVLSNNIAVELHVEKLKEWQLISSAFCICIGSFIGGILMGHDKAGKLL